MSKIRYPRIRDFQSLPLPQWIQNWGCVGDIIFHLYTRDYGKISFLFTKFIREGKSSVAIVDKKLYKILILKKKPAKTIGASHLRPFCLHYVQSYHELTLIFRSSIARIDKQKLSEKRWTYTNNWLWEGTPFFMVILHFFFVYFFDSIENSSFKCVLLFTKSVIYKIRGSRNVHSLKNSCFQIRWKKWLNHNS